MHREPWIWFHSSSGNCTSGSWWIMAQLYLSWLWLHPPAHTHGYSWPCSRRVAHRSFQIMHIPRDDQCFQVKAFRQALWPKGIAALTTSPPRWVSEHKHQCGQNLCSPVNENQSECSSNGKQKHSYLHHEGDFQHIYYMHDSNHNSVVRIFCRPIMQAVGFDYLVTSCGTIFLCQECNISISWAHCTGSAKPTNTHSSSKVFKVGMAEIFHLFFSLHESVSL